MLLVNLLIYADPDSLPEEKSGGGVSKEKIGGWLKMRKSETKK